MHLSLRILLIKGKRGLKTFQFEYEKKDILSFKVT